MRQIKFKIWSPLDHRMTEPFNLLPEGIDFTKVTEYIPFVFTKQAEGFDAIFLQFTCLKDKNGKEIYNGDILNFPTAKSNPLSVVEWHNAKGQWRNRILNGVGDGACSGAGNWFAHEVIGNIYENPELLK